MSDPLLIFKISLIFLGSLFLVFSLPPIRSITKDLPKGVLRLKWNILSILILFFFGGYIVYAFDYWRNNTYGESINFVVPLIFFFGGIFVLLVGRLASQTAMNMREIALLQHESNTDSLMNINNRRYFDKKIMEEVSVSSRYSLPLSLLFLDIDYFKNINDTYGHVIGDGVLKNLAENIKDVARDSDIIARYGGEEIAIIATNTSIENAAILAERIRKIVEDYRLNLPCASREEIRITISIGVSHLDIPNITTSEELILEADKALYRAKNDGRNRVVISRGVS